MLIGLVAIMALGPNMPSFIKTVAASGSVFRILGTDAEQNERRGQDQTSSNTRFVMANLNCATCR